MTHADGLLTITLRARSGEEAAVAMWEGRVLARAYVGSDSGALTGARIVIIDPAGVTIRTVETWPEGGGAVSLTVSGPDPAKLAAESGGLLAALVGEHSETAPTLVRFVDDAGAPLVTVGWIPLGGDVVGTGVGWQAPGVESSAILGPTSTG